MFNVLQTSRSIGLVTAGSAIACAVACAASDNVAAAADLSGVWQLRSAERAHDISAWSESCGRRPTDFHGQPQTVTIQHNGKGDSEQIIIPELELSNDACFRSPYSRAVRKDQRTLHCASPEGTLPQVSASYAFVTEDPNRLRFHAQLSRRWTIKQDTCAYTSTFNYDFQRDDAASSNLNGDSERHTTVGVASLLIIALIAGGWLLRVVARRRKQEAPAQAPSRHETAALTLEMLDESDAEAQTPTHPTLFALAPPEALTGFAMICPECEAIYEPTLGFCTADGTSLEPEPGLADPDTEVMSCTSCQRKYPGGLERCPFDNETLHLDAQMPEVEHDAQPGDRICPECATRYNKHARFCAQDGHELLAVH